jgi:hypothetical protein
LDVNVRVLCRVGRCGDVEDRGFVWVVGWVLDFE